MKLSLSLLVLISFSFSNSLFAADNLSELNLKIHNITTFKKLATVDSYEKLNEVITTEASITTDNKTEVDSNKSVNSDNLTYTINKDLIRIQDSNEQIDAEVPVEVKKSLFGKIKSFKISGTNYENVYFEKLSHSGLIIFSKLDLKKDERDSLVVGDQTCSVERSSEVVTCEEDIIVNVHQSKAVLTAALFLLEINL